MRFVGIDPATKTGVVALDEHGSVILETEIKGEGKKEKGGISVQQLVSLENQLFRLLQEGDEICIEAPAIGTQSGITTGMIHGGLRTVIHRRNLGFYIVNPMWTKKYVGVTGWTGEAGNKRRLKDRDKKEAIKAAVLQRWGYTHKSDNVVDAYVIARIAFNLYRMRELLPPIDTERQQLEVVQDILNKAI
ncbi:hypothetical protein ABEV74_20565 [Paenibacillus cisolokensis]|uniref:hypothetical protein n=1 Tax=Paenibacillus cisolokensis TaxID=1658519 RepID=UPI003D2D8232